MDFDTQTKDMPKVDNLEDTINDMLQRCNEIKNSNRNDAITDPTEVKSTSPDRNDSKSSDTSFKLDQSEQTKALETEDNEENSLNSTAFTISFNDEDTGFKRFGVRDSIKKFAPPKLFQKPPARKDPTRDREDETPSGIGSAPGTLTRRYSGRRTSKNANPGSVPTSSVADSVPAYLIERMLNSTNTDMNYPDDGSDNGTYIVGADEEIKADRQKIDELFGVMKAAEESILIGMNDKKEDHQNVIDEPPSIAYRKRLSRERQAHIDRLAQLPVRASSASRQDNDVSKSKANGPRVSRPQNRDTSTRHNTALVDQRRSVSQSSDRSRTSAGKRILRVKPDVGRNINGSRTSLDDDDDNRDSPESQSEFQSYETKYNRAVALRRARLEPVQRRAQVQKPSCPSMVSPRRPAQNTSSNSNFARDDGGRFSLRTRTNSYANRESSSANNSLRNYGPRSNQVQQTTRLDSIYASPTSSRGFSNNYTDNRSIHDRSPSDLYRPYRQNDFQLSQELQHRNEIHSSNAMQNLDSPNRSDRAEVRFGPLDNLVISAISSLSSKIEQSICNLLMVHAKQLSVDNETRGTVEAILPQLCSDSRDDQRSPLNTLEDLDYSPQHQLSKTLRNLKKMEQMIGVINLIDNELHSDPQSPSRDATSSTNTSDSHHS